MVVFKPKHVAMPEFKKTWFCLTISFKKALYARLQVVKIVARCSLRGHRTSFQFAISSTVSKWLDFLEHQQILSCVFLIIVLATKTHGEWRGFSYTEQCNGWAPAPVSTLSGIEASSDVLSLNQLSYPGSG